MPLPRYRLRTLILAVATVAVLLWMGLEGSRLWRLSRLYGQRAGRYAQSEQIFKRYEKGLLAEAQEVEKDARATMAQVSPEELIVFVSRNRIGKGRDVWEARREILLNFAAQIRWYAQGRAEQARYSAELKRKYDRAARSPWLPVAPDPPEPVPRF